MEQEAVTTESTGHEAPSAMPSIVNHDPESSGDGSNSLGGDAYQLFDDEVAPTEAELRGEEGEENPEGDDPEKQAADDPEKATEEPGKEAGKEGAEAGKDKDKDAAADADADPNKPPPKGYVPQQALYEERNRRKEATDQLYYTNQQLRQMQQELKQLKENPPEKQTKDEYADLKDFKPLSQQEFEELKSEDFEAAQTYLYNEMRYRDMKAKESEQERQKMTEKQRKEQEEAARNEFIYGASQDMRENIPELFEEGSDLDSKLVSFAEENGLDKNTAAILTNPAARVIDPNTGQEYVMGYGAANLLKFMNNTYKHTTQNNPESIRAQIEKEIREQVTKEFKAKLRGGGDDEDDMAFLGDATPASSGAKGGAAPGSEEEWMSMSAEDRRKALGG